MNKWHQLEFIINLDSASLSPYIPFFNSFLCDFIPNFPHFSPSKFFWSPFFMKSEIQFWNRFNRVRFQLDSISKIKLETNSISGIEFNFKFQVQTWFILWIWVWTRYKKSSSKSISIRTQTRKGKFRVEFWFHALPELRCALGGKTPLWLCPEAFWPDPWGTPQACFLILWS